MLGSSIAAHAQLLPHVHGGDDGAVGDHGINVRAMNGSISLAGDWQFLPGDDPRWASPVFDDSAWGTMSVPDRWPGAGYPDTDQFAWYRLTLQFDVHDAADRAALNGLGLRMGQVLSAYELYAGGQLLGGVGRLPPQPALNYDRQDVYAIPDQAIDANGKLVIALRVWGGDNMAVRSFGGGTHLSTFAVGDYAFLLRSGVVEQMPGVLMVALFFGFGIYHLYLFHRNRHLRTYLWFGLMAINVSVYSLMLNQWKYVLGWDFVTYEKIEFGAIYLFPALALQMVWTMMEAPISRLLRVYQFSFLIGAIAVVVVPGLGIHYWSLPVFHMWIVPLLLFAPVLIAARALAGHSEARTLLVGAFIFIVTCVNDVLIDQARLESVRLLPYGFVAIMLSMAVSMANRFTASFSLLEQEVDQRTADLQSANEQLAEAARMDPLTRLLNRRGFTEVAEAEIDRVLRSGREFTVVLADIDNFKSFNDRYGHACGDHVLQRVASILKTQIRDVDRAGRWGGEEFIFLLPETDADGAAVLAEKLRERVAGNVFEYNGERVTVTMTFGIAGHRKAESLDSCIARADTALYHGKERGRNRVMIGRYKGLTLVN